LSKEGQNTGEWIMEKREDVARRVIRKISYKKVDRYVKIYKNTTKTPQIKRKEREGVKREKVKEREEVQKWK